MASAAHTKRTAGSNSRPAVDQWCEWGILGLVLGILVYGPLWLGAARPSGFVVIEILTTAVLALWLVRVWASRSHRFLWPPICWGVLALLVYVVIRSQGASVEYLARQEMIRVLVYGMLFFAILNNLHRQESTRWVSLALIAVATIISIYAAYQWLTESHRIWWIEQAPVYQGRASGTYICPNHLAGLVEMLLPLALAYTMIGRLPQLTRLLLGYACFMLLVGLAATQSRGGWIAAGVAVTLLLLVLLQRPGYRLISLVCALLLGLGATYFYAHSFQARRRVETSSLITSGSLQDTRYRMWLAASQMWHDHPWWGVGPAHYDQCYRAYRQAHEFSNIRPEYVHNDYLNTLADYGLAGAFLIAWPWIALGRGIFRCWPFIRREPSELQSKTSNKSAFVLGASLGLLALLVHSITDFNLHIPANAIVAVTLMALISGHLRFASDRWWFTPRLWTRLLATLLLGTGLVYLGMQTWRLAREQWWLGQAERQAVTSPQREPLLKAAFAIEPMNFNTAYDVGQTLRFRSFAGPDDWQVLAEEAVTWYQRSARLNPLDPYPPARQGMCLDWLKRTNEALVCFRQALALDPNEPYMRAAMGWHYFQVGDYEQARVWLRKSREIDWKNNPLADVYLELTEQKLKPQ